jgi:hypothetical protein
VDDGVDPVGDIVVLVFLRDLVRGLPVARQGPVHGLQQQLLGSGHARSLPLARHHTDGMLEVRVLTESEVPALVAAFSRTGRRPGQPPCRAVRKPSDEGEITDLVAWEGRATESGTCSCAGQGIPG